MGEVPAGKGSPAGKAATWCPHAVVLCPPEASGYGREANASQWAEAMPRMLLPKEVPGPSVVRVEVGSGLSTRLLGLAAPSGRLLVRSQAGAGW